MGSLVDNLVVVAAKVVEPPALGVRILSGGLLSSRNLLGNGGLGSPGVRNLEDGTNCLGLNLGLSLGLSLELELELSMHLGTSLLLKPSLKLGLGLGLSLSLSLSLLLKPSL
ncbi:hypothetical protein LPJ66_010090, partial [Kickxella alabastrina]